MTPTFPVGDANDLAIARQVCEEQAERLYQEALRKVPRPAYVARLPFEVGPVNADPNVVEIDDRTWLEPVVERVPRISRGGIIPTPKPPRFAVGDEIVSLEPDHRGQHGTITNEAVGTSATGEMTTLWVVDFGTPARRVLHPDRMERVDSAPYRWAVKERRPIAVGCEAPATCDCGHLDALHDPTPGVGCTHRPYCLCVHPTGQRVPVTRVVLMLPSQADPALITRTVR